jgi:hypothetical protein
VAAGSWSQEQFTNAAKAAVGGRGDKFLARRIGAEEEPWEVRAGHTYELVETSMVTLRVSREGKKSLEVKIPGTASIGDVTAKNRVTIKSTDEKLFWLENGGKYQMEQTYDEEADTRLRLRIRYDAPDRTYIVDQIRFDATGDLNRFFEDLRQELGFDLPRPTQCTFAPTPWSNNQEIQITTQETIRYSYERSIQEEKLCHRT